MAYRWSEENPDNTRNPQIYFFSCKFSYLELELDETDGIFKFIKS